MHTNATQDMQVHVLLFVTGLPALTAAVLPVGGGYGVHRRALFAGGMGGVGGVG